MSTNWKFDNIAGCVTEYNILPINLKLLDTADFNNGHISSCRVSSDSKLWWMHCAGSKISPYCLCHADVNNFDKYIRASCSTKEITDRINWKADTRYRRDITAFLTNGVQDGQYSNCNEDTCNYCVKKHNLFILGIECFFPIWGKSQRFEINFMTIM